MKKFAWKIKSFAKGIDPDLASQELNRIEAVYGSLTPESVLEASRNADAPLHPLFTWEDDRAAEAYRLIEARKLINNIEITLIKDGSPRQIPAYEIICTGESRGYKAVDRMTDADAEQVRKTTIIEIRRLQAKLSFFSRFSSVISHLDNAIESM